MYLYLCTYSVSLGIFGTGLMLLTGLSVYSVNFSTLTMSVSIFGLFQYTCGRSQYTQSLSVYLRLVTVYSVPFSILALTLSILSPFQYTGSQSQYTQPLPVYLQSVSVYSVSFSILAVSVRVSTFQCFLHPLGEVTGVGLFVR